MYAFMCMYALQIISYLNQEMPLQHCLHAGSQTKGGYWEEKNKSEKIDIWFLQ